MVAMSPVARNVSLRSHFGADRSTLALSTLYFAFFAGDPTVAGIEPTSAGGYARVAVANDAALWGTISSSDISVSNAAAIVWPATTGLYSQSVLDHFAIFDNTSGGNLWYWGRVAPTIEVTGAGDTPRIPPGALTITQAG